MNSGPLADRAPELHRRHRGDTVRRACAAADAAYRGGVMNPRLIVAGLVVAACLATGAQAQVTVDVAKITCEQFAFSKIAPVRSIALWLSGYYGGKRGDATIDLQAFEENAGRVERFCKEQKNFKLPVMQAVEQVLGKK